MDKNGLVLIDQYKELVDEIGLTKQKLLEKEKELLEKNQQITLLIGQVRHKENEIEEAKEYNNRLYNDYEVNVKKKV